MLTLKNRQETEELSPISRRSGTDGSQNSPRKSLKEHMTINADLNSVKQPHSNQCSQPDLGLDLVLIRGDDPTGLCLQSAERGNSKLDSNQEHASPDRQYERIEMKHQFHHEPSLEHTTQESQDQTYGVATAAKDG